MLAAPAALAGQQRSGPRPTDLNKDSAQILDLLDLGFGPLPAGRGQRMLHHTSGSNLSSIFGHRISEYFGGPVPGFVWVESGKIVGTLSLLSVQKSGKYLVANVAVHPDYRRSGIGTGLMKAAMDYIHSRGGREIVLQVERNNKAANQLYASLNFTVIGDVNHWSASSISIRRIDPPVTPRAKIRSINRREADVAFLIDKRSMPLELRWPLPPSSRMVI